MQDSASDSADRVRPALQARSQEKLRLMLKAGRDLIEEKGFAKTHIGDIAQRAGCSVGIFYERFGNKETFFTYLLETISDDTTRQIHDFLTPEKWDGVATRELIRQVVRGYVRWFRENRGLYTAALSTPIEGGQNFTPFRRQFVALSTALAALLEDRRADLDCADITATVWFQMQMMNGTLAVAGFTQLVMADGARVEGDRSIGIDEHEMVTQLVASFLSGLGLRTQTETRP
ncbi:TetR/AcrR family transcriptional regulator [Chachezhania sediminis]|uniref:TetR/AcrR family transcriptional regulator n=1 Tax=Chachezhania sediminis TaxID=2599291 RepID=UPI00131ABC5C|nr:TetR/AcrR family transcriptional regulator [Chachezhania sediminis]